VHDKSVSTRGVFPWYTLKPCYHLCSHPQDLVKLRIYFQYTVWWKFILLYYSIIYSIFLVFLKTIPLKFLMFVIFWFCLIYIICKNMNAQKINTEILTIILLLLLALHFVYFLVICISCVAFISIQVKPCIWSILHLVLVSLKNLLGILYYVIKSNLKNFSFSSNPQRVWNPIFTTRKRYRNWKLTFWGAH
jgi:hypothetical protein